MTQQLPPWFVALSPFRSVRARFSAVMGLTGVVFVLLLTLVMEWRWESSARATAHATLHLTAQRIASSLTENLDNRQMEMQVVADLIGSGHFSQTARMGRLFDRIKARQADYAWIGYALPHGKVVAASADLLRGVNVSDRPWFQRGQQAVFLGDPHPAQLLAGLLPRSASGEPPRFLDLAVPVRNQAHQTLGVLGAHFYFDWVQGISAGVLADLGKSTPVEVLIADPQGQWLLKPPAEKSDNLGALMAQAQRGQYLMASARIAFKAPMQGTVWTVVVREESRHAFALIHDNRRLMLWFSLLVAIAFSGLAWLISGPLVQPIVQLADMARAHRQGTALSDEAPRLGAKDETAVLGQVMHQMAFYDPLTALANRRLLRERLAQELESALRRGVQGALMLFDLDNFSLLNDTQGDEVGDQLLIEVAQRLSALASTTDLVARLGSDEFVLLVTGLDPRTASSVAREIATQALLRVEQPFQIEGETYHVNISVGVCLFGQQGIKVTDLLQQVEVAMFQAKRSEHDKICFFNTDMQTALEARAQLERDLRLAIPEQLRIVYQAQVNDQGAVLGAELLLRWQHPTLGLVSPARFIPVAEETGLIVAMGQWVVAQAVAQIRAWADDARMRHLVLAVNVSAKEFVQPDYVRRLIQQVDAAGIDPSRLKLELTESILANDLTLVVERMRALRARGVRFALDDFGTGFSSLSYLKQMPLDQLKVDQSFVRDVTHNAHDASIVRTVIALGQSMQLEVIAEGVETDAQRDFLLAAGCHSFQGYLYGRPVPAAEFEQQVRARLGSVPSG